MQKIYPFKFLDSYQREDKDFFFGREEEVDLLYQMIFQTRILLIYGTSGTGKTSLIQCGLANKFQTYDWSSIYIRRGSNLLASLDKALCQESNHAFVYSETKEPVIKDLAAKLAAVYKASLKPVYLIFDQFEELYVLGTHSEEQYFIRAVKEILAAEQPVKIIISIREEYLGYLYEFERAVPELLRKKLRVAPMNLDKVKTVLTNIGRSPKSNVHLKAGEEDRIAASIFEKIRGEEKTLSIQLPYLQVFLDSLYLQKTKDETHQTETTITLEDVEQTGNIGDVLRHFLDEQVAITSKNLDQKPEKIWKILSPFVTLDGTKEPLSAQQLAERVNDQPAAAIRAVLDAFVKNRILRFTEKDQLYEIAHDSLAKQVNAKRSDEEIAILEVQRLIKTQVAVKKEAREYFTERQLLFIEPYLDKFKVSDEEQDWISRSHSYAEEQQKIKNEQLKQLQQAETSIKEAKATRKRLRIVIGLLTLAVIAVIGAVVFWSISQKQRRIAIRETKIAQNEKAIADSSLRSMKVAIDSISGIVNILPEDDSVFIERFKNIQKGIKGNIAKTEESRQSISGDKNIKVIAQKIAKIGEDYQNGIVVFAYESENKGLIISKNNLSENKLTYNEADNLCQQYEGGTKGWRLPTQEELIMISNMVKNKELSADILNLKDDIYWSSTGPADKKKVSKLNMRHTGQWNPAMGHKFSVRAVREF